MKRPRNGTVRVVRKICPQTAPIFVRVHTRVKNQKPRIAQGKLPTKWASYGEASGGGHACGGSGHTEYTDHVHIATKNGYSDAPIFDDLYGCNLPAISWVIPDQKWSDHPYDPGKGNSTSWSLGPYWVGDIINGVGTACGGKYWSGTEPTAIFVVWDDWGGWFDHVKPWAYYRGTSSACTGYAPNGSGCGYVSGFRVPLMVVSAWTGTQTQSGVTSAMSPALAAGCRLPEHAAAIHARFRQHSGLHRVQLRNAFYRRVPGRRLCGLQRTGLVIRSQNQRRRWRISSS